MVEKSQAVSQSQSAAEAESEQGVVKIKSKAYIDKPVGGTFSKSTYRVIRLHSMQQMEGLRDRQSDKMMVILFWANWYPECEELR